MCFFDLLCPDQCWHLFWKLKIGGHTELTYQESYVEGDDSTRFGWGLKNRSMPSDVVPGECTARVKIGVRRFDNFFSVRQGRPLQGQART